jgi:hypothetical protein
MDPMTYEYIDADRITRLARDLVGDLPSCVRFVDDFVAALGGRIARIQRAVDLGDLDDALASLLSLSTSSAMIGAAMLSEAARDLHAEASLSHALPGRAADRLERIGVASCAELSRLTAAWRVSA